MTDFKDLPKEAQDIFNPAFCGEILYQSICSYNQESTFGCAYPLCFLFLPIILHKSTRDLISSKIRKPMHVWIQDNQHVRLQFSQRCRDYLPITKEALDFLSSRSLLTIDKHGEFVPLRRKIPRKNQTTSKLISKKITQYVIVANKVGKWFAEAGEPSNVFTMWGVRP